MARQLRYTTFAPGELAARLRELSQKRALGPGVPSPDSGEAFSRAFDPRTEEKTHTPEEQTDDRQ